jgi:glycine dehydrogenase subunit 2
VRPGDLGVDAMHINLHKTFSTPHGGGGSGRGSGGAQRGPGAFAPTPWLVHGDDGFAMVEHAGEAGAETAFGRMSAFHGQMGMYVRAYAYMLSHGADGLRQVAEDAVLNANYIKARLKDVMSPAFPDGPCMHEALFDDSWLEGTGVTTLDFAKAMIDEGFHPMTMYFPLVVHGAMLIEPTETESKQELDRFIVALRAAGGRGESRRRRPLQGRAVPCAAEASRRDAGGPQAPVEVETCGGGATCG